MDVFREVREPMTGKLLFRYDVERRLVEVRQRGRAVLVDLAEYERLERQGLDNRAEHVLISPY